MILLDLWTNSNIYTCFQVTLSASICMSHASSEMWCWGYSLSLPQRRSILCSSSGPQPQSFCPTFSGSIRGAKEGNVRGLGHGWPGKFGFRGPSNTWKCTQDCIHNNQRVRTMKFIVFITKILYTYTSVALSSEVLLLPVSKNVVKVWTIVKVELLMICNGQ